MNSGRLLVFSQVLLILVAFVTTSRREKKTFKIAVFYDENHDNSEDLVSYAIDTINRQIKSSSFQFEFSITKAEKSQSFKLTNKLCEELDEGRIALLGIGESSIFKYLQSISSSLKVPYIAIKWENLDEENKILEKLLDDSDEESKTESNLINMHPPAHKIVKSMIDLIDFYKWDYITILFQESAGLGRIQDLIKLNVRKYFKNRNGQAYNVNSKFRVQVRQLSKDISEWIYLIKDVKLSGSSHIIVDLNKKYLNLFLEKAEEVGLMTSYFHFMFTTLDLAFLDYSPSANITALQIFEPNDTQVRSIFAEFNLKNMVSQKPMFKYMPSEAVMIFDALSLLAKTIESQNLVNIIPEFPKASCESETPWLYGTEFMKHMKNMKFNGLSGNIEFDVYTGYRKNLTLCIVDKTRTGVDLVGYWKDINSSKSIEIVRSYSKEKDQVLDKLSRNLIVTTKLEAPYVMRKETPNNETFIGNDQYKGYCVDLLVKISTICGFNYTIKLVEDGVHGALVDGKWNGIVNELIEKKADLAVAGLTITYQREQVIDFTKPFLNLGISILYKRPQKGTPNLFSFLSPLSIEIWLYMLAAYLIVSFMLFVLARFSPYEWQNPHPCKQDSGVVVNQFTVLNSLWFTIGSLMQQGTDINPRAPSVRLISCVWAFFTLILISSYTANLAAFLTVQRMQNPIENADDLSKQTEIKYGSVRSGSTENFFKESKIQTYERMWNFMSSNPDVFVKSTEEGIERVKKGGYAYLLESTTNDYLRQRDCDLMQVGGLIDTKGYGIGLPTGSPWRDQISNAILQLQEKGDLQELYIKWWEKEGKDPNQKCENIDDKKKDSASELSLANVGGVFVVLSIGLCLSFIVAILEFLWKARKVSNDQRSLKEKMIEDFKFAMCHHKTRKRSKNIKNLNLNNEIRLIEPKEYINYFEKNSRSSSLPPIDQYKRFLISQKTRNSMNRITRKKIFKKCDSYTDHNCIESTSDDHYEKESIQN
ncbi:unnamed protein product [Brachionus calyciflorus]|uniref:Uncharacterized protein n=1 Tax=Brachionus calyciflorus TaxID=104777 RepID=A0A813QKG3_9BILA|nr:unnamed protein product [Brachionus calyciflorus]